MTKMFRTFAQHSTRLSISTLALAAAFIATGAHAQAVNAKPTPIITTVAGNLMAGIASAGELNLPEGVAYDPSGNLYIADTGNNAIERVDAVTGAVTTVAGSAGGTAETTGGQGDGGPATSAFLSKPLAIAFDAAGDYFINDSGYCSIREVTTAGIIKTVAGMYTGATADCVIPAGASFNTALVANASTLKGVTGLAADAAGNVYFGASSRIYRINVPANGLYVFACAGSNSKNITGDGGAATTAACGNPTGLALDNIGNLYFSDYYNDVVRKIVINAGPAAGTISEVAGLFDNPTPGSGGTASTTPTPNAGNTGDGGQATAALLNAPSGVFVDSNLNLYIASSAANAVREVNLTTGIISTYAGAASTSSPTGTPGSSGDGGPASKALLNDPFAVAGTPTGNKIAIADEKNDEARVGAIKSKFPATLVGSSSSAQTIAFQATTAGMVSSLAVSAVTTDFTSAAPTGCSGTLAVGALCSDAVTFTPTAPGIRRGALVLTDSTGVKSIAGIYGVGQAPGLSFTAGPLTNFAGTGTAGSTGDSGAATAATLQTPSSFAFDPAGNAYIADTGNNKIRFVNATTGVITTFAGTGTAGFLGDGGAPTSAQFNKPTGVVLDNIGNVYIADAGNNRVRVVSAATGLITTLAGGSTAGSTGDGGVASAALLSNPTALATDLAGDLFIADTGNNKVREVSLGGIISTFAGTGTAGTSANGTVATAALLSGPQGVAVDSNGSVYISDTGNNLIRKVTSGVITTIAGTGTASSTGDGGAATAATINAPARLTVDAAGDVYFAGSASSRVREITLASGIINTVAGTGTAGVSPSGTISTSSALSSPNGVVVGPKSKLYISDSGNNRIALVDLTAPTLTFPSTNGGTTSATMTISAQNFGNQPLTISKIVTSSGNFTLLTGVTGDCATGTLAVGATCNLRVTYTATANGTQTGSITITDNALNNLASTQVVQLIGTGVVTPTSVAVAAGNNQTAPPFGVFATNFKVLVTGATGLPANNVSVTFTAPATGVTGTFANGTNTVTVTTAADGTATATPFSAGANRGTFMVTATVAGVATPAVFTETIAGNPAPVVTLNIPNSGNVTYGQTITINATLSPATYMGNTVTGTITFYDNGTAIGTQTVSNTGTASITYAPNAGSNSFTATYSGDSNFSMNSTVQPTVVQVAQLPVNVTTSSVSIPYGTAIKPIPGTVTGELAKDSANLTVTFLPNTSQMFPDVGTYALVPTLGGSAAGNYNPTVTGNPMLTITPAATTTTLVASATAIVQGAPLTLTATVASTVPGAPVPTGTVSFFFGTTQLNATPVALSASGTASFAVNTSTLPPGADTLTATYSSSPDNTASSGTAIVTVTAPDFSVTVNPASFTLPQGGRAYATVTVAPIATQYGKFISTVTFSCSAPATFSCIFVPDTVVGGSGTTQVTIASSGATQSALPMPVSKTRIAFAFLAIPAMFFLAGLKKRRKLGSRLRNSLGVLAFLLLLGGVTALSGCGSSVKEPVTPIGTATVNIVGKATVTNVTVMHSTPVTITTTGPQYPY